MNKILKVHRTEVEDTEKNKIIQCRMEDINHLLNVAEFSPQEDEEGKIPLKVSLTIRADYKDVVIVDENMNMVFESAIHYSENPAIQGYFLIMQSLQQLFLLTVKDDIKRDNTKFMEFVQRTLMLPIGYIVKDSCVSLVYQLIVDENYVNTDYFGGEDNKYNIQKLDENYRNLFKKSEPLGIIFLDSLIRMEE